MREDWVRVAWSAVGWDAGGRVLWRGHWTVELVVRLCGTEASMKHGRLGACWSAGPFLYWLSPFSTGITLAGWYSWQEALYPLRYVQCGGVVFWAALEGYGRVRACVCVSIYVYV